MNKKFIERKRIMIVFLLAEIKLYVKQQKEIEKDGGCFGSYYKGNVTKIYNQLQKLEEAMPTTNAYSEKQVSEMADKIMLIYFKKACRWGELKEDEKVVEPKEVARSLGIAGYELLKIYIKIKGGFLALTSELSGEYLEDCKLMIRQFETIKKFWEEEVLI